MYIHDESRSATLAIYIANEWPSLLHTSALVFVEVSRDLIRFA